MLKPAAKFFHAGRHDKYIDAAVKLLFQPLRALTVDIQSQIDPVFTGFFECGQRGSVLVAMNFSPLGKGVLFYHAVKNFMTDKMVCHTLDLTRSGRAGRITDGLLHIRKCLEQFTAEGRLAGAGWSRKNKNQTFTFHWTGLLYNCAAWKAKIRILSRAGLFH